MTRVAFGTYTPDQPPALNSQDQGVYGMLQADGVYKIANGYAPLAQFTASQNGALGAAPIGAGAYRYTGSPYLFVGTATNVYTYSAIGFTSVASGLTTSASNGLRFCPYNKFMMVTNGTDPIKQFDPASPSALTNLGGSPPTARFLAVVRGFLVAAYTAGNALQFSWSDTGNPASWTPGGSSQAGAQTLASGGDLTGLTGGEYGLLFQESRISKMTYTADTTVWQIDEIVTDIGCSIPKSLAVVGKVAFFYSNRGFMAFDGTTLEPIGDEKVNRTFQAQLDRNYTDNVSAVIDPLRSLYIITIPSSSPPTSALVYNYAEKAWTTASIKSPLMFSALSLSIPLESLDALYGSLDAMPISLDSNALRGGYPAMMLFNEANMLGSLSGSPMAATFRDGLKEFYPGNKSRISAIRPISDAVAATLTIGGMNSYAGTTTETAYTVRTAAGVVRVRENWNLSQVKLEIAAGTPWSFCLGYDATCVSGGRA